ncbi:MAG: cell division protein ZapA [Ruminococcus sp.]|nr:cell division protein ZapA [Ruminococcus sp.]
MEKIKISVQIEGRNYALISTEDEEYVKNVASEVSEHIHQVAQRGKRLDTRDCAVLTALDMCDDRNKAERRIKEVVAKADKIIRQSNELNKSSKEYKDRLTETINENTRLTKRIRALEDQLAAVLRELDSLKKTADSRSGDEQTRVEKNIRDKKNEKLMGYVPMRQYSLFDEKENENKQN